MLQHSTRHEISAIIRTSAIPSLVDEIIDYMLVLVSMFGNTQTAASYQLLVRECMLKNWTVLPGYNILNIGIL